MVARPTARTDAVGAATGAAAVAPPNAPFAACSPWSCRVTFEEAAQYAVLGDLAARQLRAQDSAVHHVCATGEMQDLRQFRRDQQDRCAGLAQFGDELVDGYPRADVDADGGFIERKQL